MLSPEQVTALERWVVAAQTHGVASQGYVAAATELSTASRDTADSLSPLPDHEGLAVGLHRLAEEVENQSASERDSYALTAALLEQFRSLHDPGGD